MTSLFEFSSDDVCTSRVVLDPLESEVLETIYSLITTRPFKNGVTCPLCPCLGQPLDRDEEQNP